MTTYELGVDYAFSSPSPSGLYAAGMRFAMRYVGPGSADKHLTAAERDALWAAGLSIVLLVEGSEDDPQRGYDVGVAHARSARAAADALGFPRIPMYFAVDRDENTTSWLPAREYLRGADSVLGEGMVGVYGERDVMSWAARDSVAAWYFQTYAWSGGNWYAGNHVEQYHNGEAMAGGIVDRCRAVQPYFGQYLGGTMSTESAQAAYIGNVVNYRLFADNRMREHTTMPPMTGSDGVTRPGLDEPNELVIALNGLAAGLVSLTASLVALHTKVDALATGGVDLAAVRAAAYDGAESGATAGIDGAKITGTVTVA